MLKKIILSVMGIALLGSNLGLNATYIMPQSPLANPQIMQNQGKTPENSALQGNPSENDQKVDKTTGEPTQSKSWFAGLWHKVKNTFSAKSANKPEEAKKDDQPVANGQRLVSLKPLKEEGIWDSMCDGAKSAFGTQASANVIYWLTGQNAQLASGINGELSDEKGNTAELAQALGKSYDQSQIIANTAYKNNYENESNKRFSDAVISRAISPKASLLSEVLASAGKILEVKSHNSNPENQQQQKSYIKELLEMYKQKAYNILCYKPGTTKSWTQAIANSAARATAYYGTSMITGLIAAQTGWLGTLALGAAGYFA